MKRILTVPTIIIILCSSMFSLVTPKIALANSELELGDFHMLLHINEGSDGSVSWGCSLAAMVYNYADSVPDGEITGVYENGEVLVDVVTSGPNGAEYSWSNGLYYTYLTSDDLRDYLWFAFSNPSGIQDPETLVGTYIANLVANGEVVDTIILETPYVDEQGQPILPTLKFPDLLFPTNGETVFDTTPTFRWLPFGEVYPGATLEWGLYLAFRPYSTGEDYRWLLHGGIWDPPPEELLVSFPDAPEYPEATLEKIAPAGKEFPLSIPAGSGWLSLVAREWFFNINGDSRCYFYTAYGTEITFNVVAEIDAEVNVEPNTLNLRSKGDPITAYVELTPDYNVADIDVSTMLLNETIQAKLSPTTIADHDEDGIPDLMVKFDRTEVVSYILTNVNKEELVKKKSMTITLTITGSLNDGTPFNGSCTVKILYPIGGGCASRCN